LSLRSSRFILPAILKIALKGIEGFGGGHEHACGATIKKEDFSRFVEQLKESLQ
ncbi:phosphoesterase, partial [archaeon]|nr:phosphoesterase [archaeon]